MRKTTRLAARMADATDRRPASFAASVNDGADHPADERPAEEEEGAAEEGRVRWTVMAASVLPSEVVESDGAKERGTAELTPRAGLPPGAGRRQTGSSRRTTDA